MVAAQMNYELLDLLHVLKGQTYGGSCDHHLTLFTATSNPSAGLQRKAVASEAAENVLSCRTN